jgi:hypothetical protein
MATGEAGSPPVGAQDRLARRGWAFDERLMARLPQLRKYARLTFLVLNR